LPISRPIHRRSRRASRQDTWPRPHDTRPVAHPVHPVHRSAASALLDTSPPPPRATHAVQRDAPERTSEKGLGRASVAPPATPQNPALLAGPRPPYPRSARRRGAQGVVVIRAKIATTGDVLETTLARSSGAQDLDHAALRAVRRWRFRPATDGRRPVEAWAQIPVRFRLTDRRL
ncbi:MAG: energy transducer TonB, partial [Deltaproteobacteria bacterium]|nr:energy transducer TonB [Deltaproteobacteria bacterium]